MTRIFAFAVALALTCAPAAAQQKLDIHGFTPGMTFDQVNARTRIFDRNCVRGSMLPHCNDLQRAPDALDPDAFRLSCWIPRDDGSGLADPVNPRSLEITFEVLKQVLVVSYGFSYGDATPFGMADPDFKSATVMQLIDVISKQYSSAEHLFHAGQGNLGAPGFQPPEVVWRLNDSTFLSLHHARRIRAHARGCRGDSREYAGCQRQGRRRDPQSAGTEVLIAMGEHDRSRDAI